MSATAERSCVVRPQDYLTHSFNQPFGNGQGKKATTIRAEQGHYVTLVTDEPYTLRNRRSSYMPRARKGARPMHASTLTIPVQDYTDYYTTNARVCDRQSSVTNTFDLSTFRRLTAYSKILCEWKTDYTCYGKTEEVVTIVSCVNDFFRFSVYSYHQTEKRFQ